MRKDASLSTPITEERSPGETDVAIVGGGVIGCAIGYYLARRGVDVLVLERGEIGREASGSNAGSLHLQIRKDEAKTSVRLALIQESARTWTTLESELGCDLGLSLHGGLMVAETKSELALLRDKLPLEMSIGLHSTLLSASELTAIEPHLSRRLLGATLCPEEGSANPLLVTNALANRMQAHGGRIQRRWEVQSIEIERKGFLIRSSSGLVRCFRIVNAAGAWAARVAGMVGVRLLVNAEVISVSVTEPRPRVLTHLVQHAGRSLTLKQTSNGTFLIGGGWPGQLSELEPVKQVDPDSLSGNVSTALRVLPWLSDVRLLRSWSGIIPVVPDALPVFGECLQVPGFFVAVVPSGAAGYTVAPVIGRLMSELLSEGRSSIALDGCSPGRFLAPA